MTDDPFAHPAQPVPGEQAPGEDLVVGGRYKLPDPDNSRKDTKFTRATTFAKTIADTYRLSLWQQRMAIKGVTMDAGLYAATASTPLEDRKKLDELVEQAKTAAGAKTRATLGTAVHTFSDQIDSGKIALEQVPEPWRPDLIAYRRAMEEAGLEVVMAERTVLCRTYDIAGTFDRVVRCARDLEITMPDGTKVVLVKGTLAILDLKTGRDLEYGWREITIQLALYANSELVLDRESWAYEEMPEVDRTVGLVLHLPVGEGRATLHGIDLVRGWRAAWLCQQARDWNRLTDLASPILVVEADDRLDLSASITAREPSYEERIRSAVTITGLQRIKIDAERQRKWTPQLQRLAEKRRDDILADVEGS